jgi:hypothetical protein
MLEMEVDTARRMGWLGEAERLARDAGRYLGIIREVEKEIAELESRCFIEEGG